VTGAVALMLTVRSSLTWQVVRRILRSTADKIDFWRARSGWSLGQRPQPVVRIGRLNVQNAVTQMD
jgi:hypothetical protein